jgi:hypothetical protein
MILTDQQIDYISTNLEFYGVAKASLKEDLIDHICTYIENSTHTDFDAAYKEAIQNFGGHYALGRLQHQTMVMTSLKKQKNRLMILYIAGFMSAFSIGNGTIFKILHWPGASIMILMGFMVLNLLVIPLFFYDRYKAKSRNIAQ